MPWRQIPRWIAIPALFCLLACSGGPPGKYWGKTEAPEDNIVRYITGPEPESLDPLFGGQPESRIMIGLYDRLVGYHPRTLEPIPSLATRWEADETGTIYTFHLRNDGRFSNGDPITASDVAYSIRRLLNPESASRYPFFAFDIKYAEAYNAGAAFVKRDGEFLAKDSGLSPRCAPAESLCLTVPGDRTTREELTSKDPEFSKLIEKAEFVPVRASDVAIETPDDFTIKFHLRQPAPYFISVLATQYFAAVHRGTIEKYGKAWTRPENIVTSGTFKVAEHRPYDELFVDRNPYYWDAENVSIDGVRFYPVEDFSTMMNLYKAGEVDATYNHTVPAAWIDFIKNYKHEYMLHPEMSIMYYSFSVNKPPVDKLEVRRALSLAIDREALSKYIKTLRPLTNFMPEGIFPEYEKSRKEMFADLLTREGITEKEWSGRVFDPKSACDQMETAGFSVARSGAGKCTVADFPTDDISLTYNTLDLHKQVAEFVQAQWKQNLGIEIKIENLEWRTYLEYGSKVEYKGIIRAGWVGDYIDPFAFLLVWYTKRNQSFSGWWEPEYDKLLEDANSELDPEKRFRKLAEAEFMILIDQPVIPLATNQTNWLKKPYLKGVYPNPGTLHPWKFVYIEKDKSKWDKDVDRIMSGPLDPIVQANVKRLQSTQVDGPMMTPSPVDD